MSVEKVLEIARGELGYTEYPPGSNRTKYWDEYGAGYQGQPWCVAFLWWCFRKAGEGAAFFGGARTASCGTLFRWYKEQGQTVCIEDIQVGDIALYNFHGGKDPEHCGLVTGRSDITDLSTGIPYSVWTIEGNTSTSGGSQSNGGMVCEKIRYPRYIVAVCRPKYKEDDMKIDYDKHWAREDIAWAMEQGYVKGYPDGSFHPDDPITRAETVTVLHRLAAANDVETASLRAALEQARAEIMELRADIEALKGARA